MKMKIDYSERDLVECEGKSYKKTRTFGNWKQQTINKNRKKYNRKDFKNSELE